jgi:signal peptidase II
MRVRVAVWLVALLVLGIDLATKWWAVHSLSDGHSIPIIGDLLSLKLVYNEGAALSILGDFGVAITVVMVLILVGLIWLHGRAVGFFGIAVFGLAMGGAMGNLYDRFTRGAGWGRGPVIDMINYSDFFIGNVADIAIVFAAAGTIAASWTGARMLTPRQGQRVGDSAPGESSSQ